MSASQRVVSLSPTNRDVSAVRILCLSSGPRRSPSPSSWSRPPAVPEGTKAKLKKAFKLVIFKICEFPLNIFWIGYKIIYIFSYDRVLARA